MTEKLLKDTEVATVLNISRRQVHRLSINQAMPAPVRLSSSVRWRASEIEAWIRAGCPDREKWLSLRRRRRDRG